MPLQFRKAPSQDAVPQNFSTEEFDTEGSIENDSRRIAEVRIMEDSIVDSSEASYRNSGVSDTLEHLLAECQDDVCRHLPEMRRSNRSMRSKASDGRLNTEFKFGGKPSPPPPMPEVPKTEKPMTLSDIIPPPSHYLSRPE